MTSLGKMDFAAKWETVLAETETVEEVGNGTTSGGTVARCLLVCCCLFCFENVGGTSERRNAEHMGFSERIDTILN